MSRKKLQVEYLIGVTVIPRYAEDAIMSGGLDWTLQKAPEQPEDVLAKQRLSVSISRDHYN